MNKPSDLQKQIEEIRNRVKNEQGVDNELLAISVDLSLKGREAINFKVAQLFAPELTPQELVTIIFRTGLHNVKNIVKELATKRGIKL